MCSDLKKSRRKTTPKKDTGAKRGNDDTRAVVDLSTSRNTSMRPPLPPMSSTTVNSHSIVDLPLPVINSNTNSTSTTTVNEGTMTRSNIRANVNI